MIGIQTEGADPNGGGGEFRQCRELALQIVGRQMIGYPANRGKFAAFAEQGKAGVAQIDSQVEQASAMQAIRPVRSGQMTETKRLAMEDILNKKRAILTLWGWNCYGALISHGLNSRTPIGSKSRTLRVTTVSRVSAPWRR